MAETIIKVEGIGKRYKIGEKERYLALRDIIVNMFKLPYKLITGKVSLKKSHIWALKDVSFEVKKGEVIGIIGKNGSGKSTLLKILSRITEPTNGQVTLNGRVSSLLEVGTGFHPELTGRENIYLNGAILGMTKKEIDSKFNDIVEFSGIEKFLDTPVKRYSSGMYVRLAFSVAAHLEPEILLVDEVLAVGDAEFQKKCLGKMKDVAAGGRTVLFVSHNMGAVNKLTNRCLLLKNGSMDFLGPTEKAIEKYLAGITLIKNNFSPISDHDESIIIKDFSFLDKKIEKGFNKPLFFRLKVNIASKTYNLRFGMGIVNSQGTKIMTIHKVIESISQGIYEIEFTIKSPRLPPGFYSVQLGVAKGDESVLFKEDCISFEISDLKIEDKYLLRGKDKFGVYIVPEVKIFKKVK